MSTNVDPSAIDATMVAVDVLRPEDVVAQIWAEVLELDAVGGDDDFFELGGDSLSAAQILTRIGKRFGCRIGDAELFSARTPRALSELLHQSTLDRSAEDGVTEVTTNCYPAVSAQRRFWFLDQVLQRPETYYVPFLIRFQGTLDAPALEQAFGALEQRQTILRTRLEVRDGELIQRVGESSPFRLDVTDLRGLPESERRPAVQKACAAIAAERIPLDGERLWRVRLFRTTTDESFLYWEMHHAITDGWSWGVLFRDLESAYEHVRAGRSADLLPLETTYGEFAVRRRKWEQSAECRPHVSYWKDVLGGDIPKLELPGRSPSTQLPNDDGAIHRFDFTAKMTAALDRRCREVGATRFMMAMAAFQAVLGRLTGRTDIAVGTPVAGRQRVETEAIAGMFVNTVVMRTDLAGDPTFRELVERVRRVRHGAFAHQDVPLEMLVEELKPETDGGRTPFFQFGFAYQNMTIIPERFARLKLTREPFHNGTALHDMRLVVEDGPFGTLWAWLEYRTDVYDAKDIARFADYYVRFLDAVLADPNVRIGSVDYISPQERDELLHCLAAEAPPFQDRRETPLPSVVSLIGEQVRTGPNRPAVLGPTGTLTYEQFDALSADLADRLRSVGVERRDRVAVRVPRTERLPAIVDAIMRIGATYVPIDPSYPRDRQELMLRDADCRAIVTESTLDRMTGDVPTFDADRVTVSGAEAAARLDRSRLEPDLADPAYVIYTSGSTGTPKGVVIIHRALSEFVHWQRDQHSDEELSGVMFGTSVCFDPSIMQMFGPLCWGGAVIVVEDILRGTESPHADRIRIVGGVPSAFIELARTGRFPPNAVTLWCGGEPLPRDYADRMLAVPSIRRLINCYGPTEDTICTTVQEVPQIGPVTLGRPMPGRRVYVVDEQLRLVPRGVIGELLTTGVGLADGYWNRPDLTAERFPANPFGPGRAYRTGDRCRWTANGELEFLGRSDHQVKIRGQRVELGEIESAIRSVAGVKDAVAVVTGRRSADQGIVAYVTAGAPFDDAACRAHVSRVLPSHMVPSQIVRIDRIPLTPNGKVDRAALPEVRTRRESAGETAPPQTREEWMVAEAFSTVLGIGAVGRHVDFFEAGGSSLKVLELIARIREFSGVDLKVSVAFEARTPCRLAAHLIDADRATDEVISRRAETGDVVPAAPVQRRFWYVQQLLADPCTYNSVEVVRIRGSLDAACLRTALAEVHRRHEAFRTTFFESDGGLMQRISPARDVPLPIFSVDEGDPAANERAVKEMVDRWMRTPFDLSAGPLQRAYLIRCNRDDHFLALVTHHIVLDEGSREIVDKDLWAAYESAVAGRCELPSLPIRYRDYAVWAAERATGETAERQLAYWRTRLEGLDGPQPIPGLRHRSAQRADGQGASHLFRTSTMGAVESLARRTGTTPFMIMATAWSLLLRRTTGRTDICVGTPVIRRPVEMRPSAGCFVNTVPLRIDCGGSPTFRELLRAMRTIVGEAVDHGDLPFDRLVDELRPARGAGGYPFFSTVIVQERDPEERQIRGLTRQFERIDSPGAKFDLVLSFRDSLLRLEYSTEPYSADDAVRIARMFDTLLSAAVGRPDTPIDELPIISAADRRQVTVDWNATGGPFPHEDLLHTGFDRQAESNPDAVAVIAGGRRFTYRDCRELVDRIAVMLQAEGTEPGELVAVGVSRSVDMIAAVLAVSKLGCGYVPIDPTYPADRIAFMIGDCGAKLTLVDGATEPRFRGVPTPLCRIDRPASDRPLPNYPAVSSDSTAYVIYTSGSTGRPKGVELTHRAAVNTVDWVQRTLQFTAADRVAFVNSLSFDLSVFDIFGVLGAGGSVRIVDEEELREPSAIASVLVNEAITVWNSAPAALQRIMPFLEESVESAGRNGAASPRPVRLVMLSGDWIPVSLPDRVRRVFPEARFVSLGGATEAAIWSNWHDVRSVDPEWPSIPYGRPIRNSRYYVLDEKLAPMPVGIPGELFIGGECVALGYHHRPELTAERFIADPFVPGGRMYRTGDRARFHADGTIEFLGRLDHQVKIRGFRVETGEIEAVLARHPAIRDAVVTVYVDAGGHHSLAAYVVLRGDLTVGSVRDYLHEQVPEYMIPSSIQFLERLPTTSNGKLDRSALPIPTTIADQQTRTESFAAPMTDAERAIQGLFEEVLRIRPVSVTADFAELGGQSLSAAVLTARIKSVLGHTVPVETLFQTPTVRGIAAKIETGLEGGARVVVPLTGPGSRAPMFLIAGAGGHVFALHKFARLLRSDRAVYGMKAVGVDGSEPPLDRVETIAERYVREILAVEPKGPFVLGGYSVGGAIGYETALQLERAGHAVERVVLFDTYAPGYPKIPALPIRIGRHLKALLWTSRANRRSYVKQRWENLRKKWLQRIGKAESAAPDFAQIGGLSGERLKLVWSRLEAARGHYRPVDRVKAPLLFVGAERPMDWGIASLDDPLKGWSDWSHRAVDLMTVPVGHMEMFSDGNLDRLVKGLRSILDGDSE